MQGTALHQTARRGHKTLRPSAPYPMRPRFVLTEIREKCVRPQAKGKLHHPPHEEQHIRVVCNLYDADENSGKYPLLTAF